MNNLQELMQAEKKAKTLFEYIVNNNYIVPGKSEKELNREIFEVAKKEFGIQKFWHKRIVRSGPNTLHPYRVNPPDLIIQEEDILFFDFGPVFEEWEADIGKTFVLGSNPKRLKLAQDVETAWELGKAHFENNKETITGAELYAFTKDLAHQFGWEYGNEHCGHLVGKFPHEKIVGEERVNYIHPDNHSPMKSPDQHGDERFWIYEIHFVDKHLQIGGFFEQLMG